MLNSYVEICLSKCYCFIRSEPISIVLERIAKAIRGISEPLAAIHLSIYLIRMGMIIDPKQKNYMLLLLENSYIILNEAKRRGFPGVSLENYMACYDMGIHWLVRSLCHKAPPVINR